MKNSELQIIKTALNKCWENLRSEGYKKFGCISQAEDIIKKYDGNCNYDHILDQNKELNRLVFELTAELETIKNK